MVRIANHFPKSDPSPPKETIRFDLNTYTNDQTRVFRLSPHFLVLKANFGDLYIFGRNFFTKLQKSFLNPISITIH